MATDTSIPHSELKLVRVEEPAKVESAAPKKKRAPRKKKSAVVEEVKKAVSEQPEVLPLSDISRIKKRASARSHFAAKRGVESLCCGTCGHPIGDSDNEDPEMKEISCLPRVVKKVVKVVEADDDDMDDDEEEEEEEDADDVEDEDGDDAIELGCEGEFYVDPSEIDANDQFYKPLRKNYY